jgi:hypothetical protein
MTTTTFEINEYTKSNVWLGNDKLVQPDGTKRCECCNKKWYSIEFPEHNGFVDGKYPVCVVCSKKKAKQERIHNLVEKYGIKTVCKKCGDEKSISHFISRKGDWTVINARCDDCRTMPKQVVVEIAI